MCAADCSSLRLHQLLHTEVNSHLYALGEVSKLGLQVAVSKPTFVTAILD